jgi:penicillin-binding protein 1A
MTAELLPDDGDDGAYAAWEAQWRTWRAWRRQRLRRALVKWSLITLVWGLVSAVLLGAWFLRDLPRPGAALDAVRRPSLIVQDASGADIATYGDVVGAPMLLTQLPAFMPQAAVSIEDRRYWDHGGIDLIGIGRALLVDLRAMRVVQGGSTIAQQVAKTLFLSDARTWRRKLQELVLTLWLERSFTKREILEIWLNRVYFGQGAWGVDAAAHIYFGISASRLSLWQAAMIAGLPRAPSRFNPRADPAAAIARTHEVLRAMVQTHAITQAQADAASGAIDLTRTQTEQGGWFADWAATQAQALIPPDRDVVLHTTLDSRLQAQAEQDLAVLLDGPGARENVHQGAVVVLDAQTGAVRAMVGGRDYRHSAYNRAVQARRQPGSAFKPFVWLTALRHGATPDDTVLDAPLRIGAYAPTDFTRRYLGPITLEEALAFSVNTASVRLLLANGGPRAVAGTAHDLGITDHLPDNASIALGSGEVGVLEMAGAYAAFCNGRRRITPTGLAALTADGRTTPVALPLSPSVITAAHAAMMERMLRAVVTRGTGTAAAIRGHDVFGKTGTTQDFRDAWFIGCLDHRSVIATWLGNDDNAPMRRVEGGSLPARLFAAIGEAMK